MKKFYLIPLVVALLLVLVMAVYAADVVRVANSYGTLVNTNAVALSGTGAGKNAAGYTLYNVSGGETVKVLFASTEAYATSSIAILPGATVVFPSLTYDFVPGGTLYGLGATANVTNTIIVKQLLK